MLRDTAGGIVSGGLVAQRSLVAHSSISRCSELSGSPWDDIQSRCSEDVRQTNTNTTVPPSAARGGAPLVGLQAECGQQGALVARKVPVPPFGGCISELTELSSCHSSGDLEDPRDPRELRMGLLELELLPERAEVVEFCARMRASSEVWEGGAGVTAEWVLEEKVLHGPFRDSPTSHSMGINMFSRLAVSSVASTSPAQTPRQ
eukprot:6103788-Pyramimonas_sp.AAC.1